jgi:hypothetical protein
LQNQRCKNLQLNAEALNAVFFSWLIINYNGLFLKVKKQFIHLMNIVNICNFV